jgi:APA family basic amino acid/polyamine antiporter
MGFWTSSARVLYGSAQLNMLPHAFMKLNKHGQPYLANLVVLIFSVLFCLFSASDWVRYIYAVSCIAAGLVYLMVCYDTYKLRKQHPDWERPYKAPFGNWFLFLGMGVSLWVVAASSLSLDFNGWMSLVVYMLVGVAVMFFMQRYRKNNPGKMEPILLTRTILRSSNKRASKKCPVDFATSSNPGRSVNRRVLYPFQAAREPEAVKRQRGSLAAWWPCLGAFFVS